MSKLSADLVLDNLKNKVKNYETVLENTIKYREVWKDSLKQQIKDDLEAICTESGIKYEFIENSQYINLDSLILSLGNTKSGIYQAVEPDIQSHLIRHNGSLLYQQIFNGKILVQVHYPMIDKYLEARQPKTIGIYRPEEIKTPFVLRHIETLISEITAWEDYDDDENIQHSKIGFTLPHTLSDNETEKSDD